MDKAKERLQRIIRTERYANKVKQLFFDTVNEITALSKSLPVLEEGVMFSFEGENRKKQLQVERALRKLHSFATVAIEQGIDLEWEEANKTCDELLSTQFGKASLQSPFFKAWTLRNHDVRDAFAKRTDNGMNLSQRIWKYVDQFRDEMEIAMTVAITEGESASEMSRKVRQYLQDPDLMFRRFRYKTGEDADGNPIYGKKWKKKVRDDKGNVRWIDYDKDSYEVGKGMYKSAYKNAMRVARTETNMAYRKADNVRWQQMDFVTGQRISLSKKHPCEDICDDLAGEYPKSFVFTGWHPQCFCYVTPILGDEDEMAKITDAFLEGKDYEPQFEQLEEYPKGFEKWVKEQSDRIEKGGKLPYFIRDNKSEVDRILHPGKETAEIPSEKERIESNRREYERLKADPNYNDVEFNPKNGGLKAVHIGHERHMNIEKKRLAFGSMTPWALEQECQELLYKNGFSCILNSEHIFDTVSGKQLKVLDSTTNGMQMDIASITQNGKNTIRSAISKKRQQLKEVNARTGEHNNSLILHFHEPTYYNEEKVRKQLGETFKRIIVVLNTIPIQVISIE